MTRDGSLTGLTAGFHYVGRVPASRPASDYTPRVIPHHDAARVPLEAPWILWPSG